MKNETQNLAKKYIFGTDFYSVEHKNLAAFKAKASHGQKWFDSDSELMYYCAEGRIFYIIGGQAHEE